LTAISPQAPATQATDVSTQAPQSTEPSATEPPTTVPETPPTSSPQVLYQDDFSDPITKWHSFSEKVFEVHAGDGQLVVQAITPDKDVIARPGMDFTDALIEVDVTRMNLSGGNRFGLICRAVDDKDYYYFAVSLDGSYVIGRRQVGNYKALASGDFKGVKPGNALNQLAVECTGSTLTFTINGEQAASATDTTFAHGDAGVIVISANTPNVEAAFDNFFVYPP
ncbi:MAG TPA: hypothetical protein VIV15_05945, partial [Anaerolineales bacterium]